MYSGLDDTFNDLAEFAERELAALINSTSDVPLPEIKLTLELVAQFKSVTLSIANGLLRAIAPGQASNIARLKCKGVKIKEQATPDWKLPGEIELGAGLRID